MARTTQVESIDSQITNYVSGLSEKSKMAVLTVVKNMSEAEKEAEFERKWAEGGLTPEELRDSLLTHIRSLEWKKKK